VPWVRGRHKFPARTRPANMVDVTGPPPTLRSVRYERFRPPEGPAAGPRRRGRRARHRRARPAPEPATGLLAPGPRGLLADAGIVYEHRRELGNPARYARPRRRRRAALGRRRCRNRAVRGAVGHGCGLGPAPPGSPGGHSSPPGLGGSRFRLAARRQIRRSPLCHECGHEGSPENPLTCDHIVSIAAGGDVWSPSNHQTLCKSCNSSRAPPDLASLTGPRRPA
jgi:5-methylcytosine-specific restriction endonuclease McrA